MIRQQHNSEDRFRLQRTRRLLRAWPIAIAFAVVPDAVLGAASAASANHWNTARWQALFDAVPPPPPTPAKAAAMIGPVKDSNGDATLWVTDATLLRLHTQRLAGFDAMQTAAVAGSGAVVPGGVDFGRMRSDPAYAKQVNQRVAAMTTQQRMQMAMQMGQARVAQAEAGMAAAHGNPEGVSNAVSAVNNYLLIDERVRLGDINRTAGDDLQKITATYDKRHAALDAASAAKLRACPQIHGNGDYTIPDPRCVANINNVVVPGVIAKHRQLAQAELNEERALFAHTRAALQPIMGKAAHLGDAAEHAGATGGSLQLLYGTFDNEVHTLQSLTDLATVRAGFWQDIRQQKTDGFSYTFYRAPLGLPVVPAYPPKGWAQHLIAQ